MLKNKKADENTAISSPAQKNRTDSYRLSDKIKVLYRYLRLNNIGKLFVFVAINSAYEGMKKSNIDNS